MLLFSLNIQLHPNPTATTTFVPYTPHYRLQRAIGHVHRTPFARPPLATGAAQSGPAARHQRDLAGYPAHNILSNRQGRPAVTPPVSKSVTSINAPASGRVQRGNDAAAPPARSRDRKSTRLNSSH